MSYAAAYGHIDDGATAPQVPPQRATRYWAAFAAITSILAALMLWSVHSPGQDHLASIPLNGDGAWYHNYEVGFEIQDFEIFFDDIGHSVGNAKQADIIFLGWSRLLFGIDWRLFDTFGQKHHLRMFNMGLADVYSGDLYLRIIRKWDLHPKLWVINADRDLKDYHNGFFFMTLSGGRGTSAAAKVVKYGRLRAYKNVIGRNVRWRAKMALGLLKADPYRSATTGNWYLDDWPNYASNKNSSIKPMVLSVDDGALRQRERVDQSCPVLPEEVGGARHYLKEIGGAAVLIQVPSAFACAQRLHELSAALTVPAFTVDQTQFTSIDGGGHLDGISARKYTAMLFAWLEQRQEFRQLFPANRSGAD
jgi:hypothetical protein